MSLWSVEPVLQLEAGISEVGEEQGCAVRTATNSSFTRERETQGQGSVPSALPISPGRNNIDTSQPGSYHLQDGNSRPCINKENS